MERKEVSQLKKWNLEKKELGSIKDRVEQIFDNNIFGVVVQVLALPYTYYGKLKKEVNNGSY